MGALENDFGSGTANSHFEEGIRDGTIIRYDYVVINNVEYPSIPEEIMTGFVGSTVSLNNYLSLMTLYILQDIGFEINFSINKSSKFE